jgi:hypothetical protein
LQRDADAAATEFYSWILQDLVARTARWSVFHLSLHGRSYVAKQVLVFMFTFHATFIPVPQQLLAQLSSAIYTFVAGNRPLTASVGSLYPSREVCTRVASQGAISLVDIRGQLAALQAKIIAHLLEPECLPWKVFFDFCIAPRPGLTAKPLRLQHVSSKPCSSGGSSTSPPTTWRGWQHPHGSSSTSQRFGSLSHTGFSRHRLSPAKRS